MAGDTAPSRWRRAAGTGATPTSVRTLILAQQQGIQAHRQENDELRLQLTALATKLAQLQERIGRSSRNSS
jgi:hypothetical protein